METETKVEQWKARYIFHLSSVLPYFLLNWSQWICLCLSNKIRGIKSAYSWKSDTYHFKGSKSPKIASHHRCKHKKMTDTYIKRSAQLTMHKGMVWFFRPLVSCCFLEGGEVLLTSPHGLCEGTILTLLTVPGRPSLGFQLHWECSLISRRET